MLQFSQMIFQSVSFERFLIQPVIAFMQGYIMIVYEASYIN